MTSAIVSIWAAACGAEPVSGAAVISAPSTLNQDARIAAFRAARNNGERLQAARGIAATHLAAGRPILAEWWLRKAANHAETAADMAQLQQDFHLARAKNPLSVQVTATIIPSSNINGGSKEEVFSLGDIKLVFGPASRALSGTEFSAQADASYRVSQNAVQSTEAGLYLYGRSARLDDASQAKVPWLRGSDYAMAVAEVSLRHRRLVFQDAGPTGVSLHFGQVWNGGLAIWRYEKLSLSQDFRPNDKTGLSVLAAFEHQRSARPDRADARVFDLKGKYARVRRNNDLLEWTVSLRKNDSDYASDQFSDVSTSLVYSPDRSFLGGKLLVSMGFGRKTFPEFILSLNGRRDDYASLGGSLMLTDIAYLGFSPVLSLAFTRTTSNVARYSSQDLRAGFAVQSRF